MDGVAERREALDVLGRPRVLVAARAEHGVDGRAARVRVKGEGA